MSSKPTCATCAYMGGSYHGSHHDWGGKHHTCRKEGERRRDAIKPSGDAAEDFMRNFRAFFDARAGDTACKYYEQRAPLDGKPADILRELKANGGKFSYDFFSEGNRVCEQMSGRFVERDEYARNRRKPSDGTRDWMLTKLGEMEADRIADAGRAALNAEGEDAPC